MAGLFDSDGFLSGLSSKVRDSGIPGYSQAAGLAKNAIWGGEPEAQAPAYSPYTYDQSAFNPSLSAQNDAKQLRGFRNQTLQQGNLGQADSGLFAENLARQNAVASGQGPSIAEMQMQRQVAANNAQQAAAAGSARGQGSMMLAQMNAGNMANANNRDAAYAGQLARAKEMEDARQGLFTGIYQNRKAATEGQNAQSNAINATSNGLLAGEKYRSDLAVGYQDRNAAENAHAQGRAFDTWDRQNAANAAQEAAAQNQSSQNTQLGANMAMKYLGK